jgi:hypothetical protein
MSIDFDRLQSRLHEAKNLSDADARLDAVTDILHVLIRYVSEREKSPLKDMPVRSE